MGETPTEGDQRIFYLRIYVYTSLHSLKPTEESWLHSQNGKQIFVTSKTSGRPCDPPSLPLNGNRNPFTEDKAAKELI
jgi:hypothetical protein